MENLYLEPRHFVSYITNMLSAVSFFWMGLYVVTRDWKHKISLVAGCTAILFSLFPLGNALVTTTYSYETFVFIQKATWWVAPLSIASWFFISVMILDNVVKNSVYKRYSVIINFLKVLVPLFGIIFSYLGVATNLIFDYNAVPIYLPEKYYMVFKLILGPLNPFYDTFLFISVVISGINATIAYRFARKNQIESTMGLRFMFYAAIFMALGAIISSISFTLEKYLWSLFADLILLIGLLIFSYGVLKYNTLSSGYVIWTDLRLSLFTTMLLCLFYTLIHALFIFSESTFLQANPAYILSTTDNNLSFFNWRQFSISLMLLIGLFMTVDYLRLGMLGLITFGDENALQKKLLTLIQASAYKSVTDDLEIIVKTERESQFVQDIVNDSITREFINNLDGLSSVAILANSSLNNLEILKSKISNMANSAEDVTDSLKANILIEFIKEEIKNIYNNASNKQKKVIEIVKLRVCDGLARKDILGIKAEEGIFFSESTYDNHMNKAIILLKERVIEKELIFRKNLWGN